MHLDIPAEQNAASNQKDTDGWTADAIRALCLLHIPCLAEYNSGDLPLKRRHWKSILTKLLSQGFSGFTALQISRKWRYLFGQYKRVKDNNGKTGRGRMCFKYYEMMHSIFLDNQINSSVLDPDFSEPTTDHDPIPKRARTGNSALKSQYLEDMKKLQQTYNEESLRLQREAVELEKQKIELLKNLLEKP